MESQPIKNINISDEYHLLPYLHKKAKLPAK